MTRKLCVAGCSVSDYTDVDEPYGQILAKKLGFEYLHEGAGCGSNYRIWRKLTNHIMRGNLTENDIIVIQYTEVVRMEFWSALNHSGWNYRAPDREHSHEGGQVLRWKPLSHAWQPYEEEKKFFRDYEKYFVSVGFAEENFLVNNFNFQHMLKNHNLKVIFLQTTRNTPKLDFMLDHFKPFQIFDDSNNDFKYNLRDGDTCHFSPLGHELMADRLENHIKQLGWA